MHLRQNLIADLRHLGVTDGDLLMVHASLRRIGAVLGGPNEVIEALLDAVGPEGTVMAYVDWQDGAQGVTRDDRASNLPDGLLEAWPPFDPAKARADRSYGALPELLRTWPGARRSGNPGASVTAVGARAEWVCSDHPLQYGYGPGSPLEKLVRADGKVALLGSPLENTTLLHFSEHVADLPDKKVIRYREPLLEGGQARWVEIEEFDTSNPVVDAAPPDHFGRIMKGYLDEGKGKQGRFGGADAYLFEAGDLHDFAVATMERWWG